MIIWGYFRILPVAMPEKFCCVHSRFDRVHQPPQPRVWEVGEEIFLEGLEPLSPDVEHQALWNLDSCHCRPHHLVAVKLDSGSCPK